MVNNNIVFLDENDISIHEQLLAKLIAEALLYQVRMEKEDNVVKQERK